jgi:hypothetical protein
VEQGSLYLSSANSWQVGACLVGDVVYQLGGGGGAVDSPHNINNYILQISASTGLPIGGDPAGGYTEPILSIPMGNNGTGWEIGNHIAFPWSANVGGWPGTKDLILFDPSSMAQRHIVGVLPAIPAGNPSDFWIGPCETDGCLYMFDNQSTPHVWKSASIKLTGPTRVPGSVAPIQCWADSGQLVMLTTTVQRGFPSWWCNHTNAI